MSYYLKVIKLFILIFLFNEIHSNEAFQSILSLNLNLSYLQDLLQNKKSEFSLVGPFLINKNLTQIYNEKERKENNIPDASALIAYDEKRGFYQPRVLPQEWGDCGYHAIKNILILLISFSSQWQIFFDNYALLFNKNFYLKLVNFYKKELGMDITCSKGLATGGDLKIFEFLGKSEMVSSIFKNINYDEINSAVNLILPSLALSYPKASENEMVKDLIKGFKDNMESMAQTLVKYEGMLDNQAIKEATKINYFSFFYYPHNLKLYKHLKKLHESKSYAFGISLRVMVPQHALGCVVHKADNRIEILLLDSLNWSFYENEEYINSLNKLKFFIDMDLPSLSLIIFRALMVKYFTYLQPEKPKRALADIIGLINDLKSVNLLEEKYLEKYKDSLEKNLLNLNSKMLQDLSKQESENIKMLKQILNIKDKV